MGVLFDFKQDDVDKTATLKQVRSFFTDDLVKLEDMAGQSVNFMLTGPSADLAGVRATNGNAIERQMINGVDARRELVLIADCLRQCKPKHQQIIKLRSFHDYSTTRAIIESGFSRSQFFDNLNSGLLEFARIYARHGRDLQIKQVATKGMNWMSKATKWAMIGLTVLLAVDLFFFVGYMLGWKFLLFLL